MAAEEIRAIKDALGVVTDNDLAKALGVERSTVAQWKRRGAIPEKYSSLTDANQAHGMPYDAMRMSLYLRPERQFLIRTALCFVPSAFPFDGDLAKKGVALEELLLRLVQVVKLAAERHLGKSAPTTEAEYLRLVSLMEQSEAWEVQQALHGWLLVPIETPQ